MSGRRLPIREPANSLVRQEVCSQCTGQEAPDCELGGFEHGLGAEGSEIRGCQSSSCGAWQQHQSSQLLLADQKTLGDGDWWTSHRLAILG